METCREKECVLAISSFSFNSFSYLGVDMSFTPFCRFSSKSKNNFSKYSNASPENPVFDGLSGFLQLGVVVLTSNIIANVTFVVHTF